MTAPANKADRAPGDGFLVAWVGGPAAWEPELVEVLRGSGVFIEDTPLSSLAERVNQRAPDLVVLSGAAGSAPRSVVDGLAQSHPASSVPVVAIGEAADARPKPRSRFGLVARLDEGAGVETLARQVRTVLRSLSRRPARWRIPARGDDLDAVIASLDDSARCGVLASEQDGALVVGPGGVAPATERLARRLDPGEITLTLFERPRARLRILTSAPRADVTAQTIHGARVLVVDTQADRGSSMARRLEQGGAQTRACAAHEGALAQAKTIDPTLVVVCASALLDPGVRALWEDVRLASASLLVLTDELVASAPTELLLLGPASEMCRSELSLARRLRKGEAVAERLETLGTARWIRLLGQCESEVTFRVYAAAGRGRVDLVGGKMRGAAFRPTDTRMGVVEGRAAIDLLMQLPFGRVLAGPPGELKSLEGVRTTRKTSVVGRIVPAKGKLAAELFVERVGESATNLGASSFEAAAKEEERASAATARPTAPAKASASSRVVVPRPSARPDSEDEPEDDVDALRRELGLAPGVSSGADARPTDRPARKKKRADSPRPTPRTGPPKRVGAEPPSAPLISPLPKPAGVPKEARKLSRDDDDRPRSTGGAVLGFVAALALGVGVFAAYQLAREEPATPHVGVEPGPPVTDPGRGEVPDGPGPDAPSVDTDHAAQPTDDALNDDEPSGALNDDAPSDDGVGDDALSDGDDAPNDDGASDAANEDSVSDDASNDDGVSDDARAADGPDDDPGPAIAPPPADATVSGLIQGALEASRVRSFARSETLARQALALSPHNSQAAYRLAVALYRQREYDEALQWSERSERWDPTSPLPAALRGDIHMRTGHFHSAAAAYRRALEIEPRFGPAERQLARLAARREEGDAEEPAPAPSPHAPPSNPFE